MKEFKLGEEVATKLNKHKFPFKRHYVCSFPSLSHPVCLNKFYSF